MHRDEILKDINNVLDYMRSVIASGLQSSEDWSKVYSDLNEIIKTNDEIESYLQYEEQELQKVWSEKL